MVMFLIRKTRRQCLARNYSKGLSGALAIGRRDNRWVDMYEPAIWSSAKDIPKLV